MGSKHNMGCVLGGGYSSKRFPIDIPEDSLAEEVVGEVST